MPTQEEHAGRLTSVEAVVICLVWLAGCITIWQLTVNYHGEQSISLENAIAYIVTGAVLITGLVLFLQPLREWLSHRLASSDSQKA